MVRNHYHAGQNNAGFGHENEVAYGACPDPDIKTIDCATAADAFNVLLDLAQNDQHEMFFRGLGTDSHDISSTYSRYTTNPHNVLSLEEMVDHFVNSVTSTGKELPFGKGDKRGKLEYARHYGLPSPLIDWSFSPYVSMYFAFSGVNARDGGTSVVCALDIQAMAGLFATALSKDPTGTVDGSKVMKLREKFFPETPFSTEYPSHELFFLNYPAAWNTRMIRQMGAFLYDTLDYSRMGAPTLEKFIEHNPEIPGPVTQSALTRVTIPHSEASRVFTRLELAGITGTRLLDDYEGAVADVRNAYNYNRKGGYTWTP